MASGTPELLIWVDSVREPAAKAYQESVKGDVDVTVEVIDTAELLTKIALFNTTGSGWPDVVFAGAPNDVAMLADPSNGYAANLSETVDESVFDDYNGANDWCLIEGSYYCLKNDLAQSVLWYDAAVFEELGLTVPTTMEEFATEAMKLEGTGYVAGAIGDQNFYAVLPVAQWLPDDRRGGHDHGAHRPGCRGVHTCGRARPAACGRRSARHPVVVRRRLPRRCRTEGQGRDDLRPVVVR